jgi:hypothetical protein
VVICANDHLNTSLTTHEESYVDPWSKPYSKTLMSFEPPSASVDFVHILQNFPKHFKITKGKNVQNFKAHMMRTWHPCIQPWLVHGME